MEAVSGSGRYCNGLVLFSYFLGKLLVFIGLITAGIFLVFSVVAFLFIQDHFNETDDNPLFCNSLWQCFISVSREGLLDTLGQVSFIFAFMHKTL